MSLASSVLSREVHDRARNPISQLVGDLRRVNHQIRERRIIIHLGVVDTGVCFRKNLVLNGYDTLFSSSPETRCALQEHGVPGYRLRVAQKLQVGVTDLESLGRFGSEGDEVRLVGVQDDLDDIPRESQLSHQVHRLNRVEEKRLVILNQDPLLINAEEELIAEIANLEREVVNQFLIESTTITNLIKHEVIVVKHSAMMHEVTVKCDLHVLSERECLAALRWHVSNQMPDAVSCPFQNVKSVESIKNENVAITVNLDIHKVETVGLRSRTHQDSQRRRVQIRINDVRLVV